MKKFLRGNKDFWQLMAATAAIVVFGVVTHKLGLWGQRDLMDVEMVP